MNRTTVSKLWPLMAGLVVIFAAFTFQQKPTIYIIGDSTVRNTGQGMASWGSYIINYLDSNRVNVSNQAMAGRSTRTFVKEGRWDKVLSTLKPGDFVLMQFGHNEGSKPDTTKAGYRGVLRGIGDSTVTLTWKDGTKETVLTYGAYLRKFVRDAKAKGATPIVVSMIPRNDWKDGKVLRADNNYGLWARQIAEQEKVPFIDLNKITADKYDVMGPEKVKTFFPFEHTHTNEAGAIVNAESVIEGIKMQKSLAINKYIR